MKITDLLFLRFVPGRLRLACYGMGGAVAGLGFCVAYISNATSYLSDDPKACINCHIMDPEYASWQHSSHGRDTVCNDCHVPHDNSIVKYWFKGKDGSRHSYMFTFRMERQVIQAIPESKDVIQRNCIRCHGTIVSEAMTPTHKGFDRQCIDCHREVPHGRVHSLTSTPNAAIPPLSPVTPNWFPQTPIKEAKK
jgi:cytochrome c nitrite reductase small subunit